MNVAERRLFGLVSAQRRRRHGPVRNFPVTVPPTEFDDHLRRTARDREQSKRFVKRVSWGIVGLLVSMALLLWLLPVERRAGHRTVAAVMELSFVAEFFALIALVLVLRRRLALQVERLSEDHEVLLAQNMRLEQQNADLAIQAATVSKQAAELEHQSAELQLSTRRLAEAQRVARLGYWEIDSTTGDVFWSDEMYRIAGLEVGTRPVPTDKFIAAVHPDDRQRMADVAAKAVENLTEVSEQYRITPPGGPMRMVQSIGRVIVNERGERRLVGTVQVITDRANLERQLRRVQKMEALGQLAGGVAHDFNNMLTVIESYSAMLLTDRAIGSDARADIEEILAAARRAAALTRQLLAFSRQQVLQPRVLNINDAIGDVERMLRRLIDGNIEFRTKLDPSLDKVMADPTQIEQVLLNLVVNARDAMPDGGIITIETGNVMLDASFAQRAPAPKPGPYVMLAVSDTGGGIATHVLDRIFEPFFTTKDVGRGTGLGLATVQGIVEQSGGHVWVYSELNQGTTFKVYLPRAEAVQPVLSPAFPVAAVESGRETILLVEDDAAVRAVTGSVLRRAGHAVVEASDGHEALRLAEQNDPAITLVISDMVMPGMGGRALAAELANRNHNVPIVLMSGYTRDSLDGNSELGSGGAFIEKPFTPDKLLKKISEVLEAARARAQA